MNTFTWRALVLFIALVIALPPSCLHAAQVVRFADYQMISTEDMVDEISKDNIILIGEYHALKSNHEMQLDLIRRIRDRTPDIAIGLEMFSFQDNPLLEMWVSGELSEAELVEHYNARWAYPFDLYKEIIYYARDNSVPLIGLNVPRGITMKVREKGFSSLTESELSLLPSGVSCNVTEGYMEFIRSVLGKHDNQEGNFENFCQAQMLWDQTMALVITDYVNSNKGTTMIALAGIMHAWKPAIPFQIENTGSYNVSVILPIMQDIPTVGLNNDLLDYLIIEHP